MVAKREGLNTYRSSRYDKTIPFEDETFDIILIPFWMSISKIRKYV